MPRPVHIAAFVLLFTPACLVTSAPRADVPATQPVTPLSAEEKQAGWKQLFDGKTTAGWRGYRSQAMPDGWRVQDGALVRTGGGGDIITVEQFSDFELALDWKITPGGNSGIMFRVSEDEKAPHMTGPEMQVLDNAGHRDGKEARTSAGANYALHAPTKDLTKPVGEWNSVRLVVRGAHVEHWLNGQKVVEYELGTPQWEALVAGSKFKAWPRYGREKKGHIALQDHGAMVAYRNIRIIRIRPLSGT